MSTSAYWDNLSKIWLTKGALRELDRRNRRSRPQDARPDTQSFAGLEMLYDSSQPVLDFLCGNAPAHLKQIKRFSRRGGPNMSDIRNHPAPQNVQQPAMNSTETPPECEEPVAEASLRLAAAKIPNTTKSPTISVYSRNFQQNLIDNYVYPPAYKGHDGRRHAKPDNWGSINIRLAQRRASMSSSDLSEEAFEKFAQANADACKEQQVLKSVIPIIEGDHIDSKCVGGGYIFGNLAHLTDGTLAPAKPDCFDGARPEWLNCEIRKELDKYIIPSTQADLPILSNFFLEVKGPDGSYAVVTRQACYDGALGARAMHSLRSYRQQESVYDNNAYTIASTYNSGQLNLYTVHPIPPSGAGNRPEYVMTLLNSWSMIGNVENFRQGVSAYRNARDWANERRDECIKLANEKHSKSQSQNLNLSTVPGAPERHNDVPGNFAILANDSETEPWVLGKGVKRPRADSEG